MNKLIIFAFAALFLSSVSADSCAGTALDSGPDVIKFGLEAQEGDYSGIGSFVSSLGEICDACDLECGFLNVLAKNKKLSDSLGCISGVVNSVEGLVQAGGSAGIDVFGDAQLAYGLYKTIEDCSHLVEDLTEESKQQHEDSAPVSEKEFE